MNSEAGAKFDYARKLAASLCYVGLVRLDTIALQPFSSRLERGNTVRRRPPPLQPGHGVPAAHARPTGARIISKWSASSFRLIRNAACWSLFPIFWMTPVVRNRCNTWPISATSCCWFRSGPRRTAHRPGWASWTWWTRRPKRGCSCSSMKPRASRIRGRSTAYAAGLQQIALRNGGRYVGVSTGMPIEDIIFGSLVRSRVIA